MLVNIRPRSTLVRRTMGNWDFDGEELLFFFLAGIFAILGTITWYLPLARTTSIGERGARRILLALTPPIALAALWFVLASWADPQYVVGQLDYQLLFIAGGLTWLWVVAGMCKFLGVSARDDAIERRNSAAAVNIAGAMLGAMLIYAACNVGSGPTIWTTILPALVATGTWLVLWLFVELISRPAEAITVDRDRAAGARQAGYLLAAGLILGRAMAGDWTSWNSTFAEFRALGWPALMLTALAIVLNRLYRPSPSRPQPPVLQYGLVPAAGMLLLAIGYVISLGPADIGKHVISYEQYMQEQ